MTRKGVNRVYYSLTVNICSPYPEALMDPRSHLPAIVDFYRTHRRMPTYREIMRLAGFHSTNAAAKLVKKLVAAQLLQQDDSCPVASFRKSAC